MKKVVWGGETMRVKIICLPIVIALSTIIFLSLSEFASAATAPVSTPLGYNTLQGCAPARIATDSSGKIYVTDANTESVRVFSNNGVPLSNIRANKPLGVAVDSSGKIFVGSVSEGSVSVFSSEGSLLYKLGAGTGEFTMPSDIAISSSGTVYVTDSLQNKVKSYTTAGAPLSSIAGLNFPTGIAVDDAAGEIYVSDHSSGTVKIFGMDGILKRYIKGGSMFGSVFLRPQGLALDSTRVYIVDAYNSTVAVYGKDGIFLKYMGNYGEGAGQFRTPLDVVIDRSNKVFVTNHNNSRIEMIGIDSYSQLNISPNTINLSVFEDGSPITQTLNLTSTGNAAGWVASSSNSWATASPAAGTTPSDVYITVDPAGLSAGNYTAQVMFSTSSGTESVVLVNLEVKPQPKALYVAPTNISFKYQMESPNYPSGNVAITSSGGSLAWTASSNAAWISPDRASGITPDNIKLSINSAVGALGAGNYAANLIIDGGSAQGSPASVNVSLTVINAGTVKVTANIKEAGFDIIPTGTGTSYSGTGTEWSYDEVTPGDYTITFKHISGYIKPYTRTFTVKTGKETVIDGTYRVKAIATHIIAGSGGTKGKTVEVLTLDGKVVTTFEPFKAPESIGVAAGDLDGSGTDKIIVTDHKKDLKVYSFEGLELASLKMEDWHKNATAAAADIDNDGKADLIAGVENDRHSEKEQRRIIKHLVYEEGKLIDKGEIYAEDKEDEFTIALGDINGDGKQELIIADEDDIRAFEINLEAQDKLKEIWKVEAKGIYEDTPEIATGDINDDGIYEIALGIETEDKEGENDKKGKEDETGIIKILKGNGEDYKLRIEPYNDLGYEGAPSVALGDLDKDGLDEILAGAGKDEKNEGLIRTYESDGSFTNTTIKTGLSKFGVNIAVGRFK
ncbi:MAG: hypothetical protein FD156_1811 [Nitrospirae bacterium]|nr:MAG: hypothetical protein FD156_1811 [Nitrospirota bacterium]